MDDKDIERLAVDLYRNHGLEPTEPTSAVDLARTILGDDDPIQFVRWLPSGNGALFRYEGRWRIALRRGARVSYQVFALSHELAHVVYRDLGHDATGLQLEKDCDYLAACLIAPQPAAVRLHAAYGDNFAAQANAVGSDQSWAIVRHLEATGRPGVLVKPKTKKLRYRGARERLPNDQLAFEWAGGTPGPGILKVRLTDDRKRVVLIAR